MPDRCADGSQMAGFTPGWGRWFVGPWSMAFFWLLPSGNEVICLLGSWQSMVDGFVAGTLAFWGLRLNSQLSLGLADHGFKSRRGVCLLTASGGLLVGRTAACLDERAGARHRPGHCCDEGLGSRLGVVDGAVQAITFS